MFFSRTLLSAILFLLIFAACKQEENSKPEKRIVAKAGEEELGMDEYEAGMLRSAIIKDSAFNAKRSIEKWATEALFYQEALSKLGTEEIQINKEVEEYRRTLVNHLYQTRMVDANLDTIISPEEIETYYNEHRDNFILKDNLVKVNYLKIPLKATALPKMKKLLAANNPKDHEQLMSLCAQNAENSFMNDSTWLFVDDIKKEIPGLREHDEYSYNPGKVIETEDDQYYYYLKVKDVKIKNSYSPLNFESQNIKKFILNNRKTQLITQYKQSLLEKAKAEKTFTVY